MTRGAGFPPAPGRRPPLFSRAPPLFRRGPPEFGRAPPLFARAPPVFARAPPCGNLMLLLLIIGHVRNSSRTAHRFQTAEPAPFMRCVSIISAAPIHWNSQRLVHETRSRNRPQAALFAAPLQQQRRIKSYATLHAKPHATLHAKPHAKPHAKLNANLHAKPHARPHARPHAKPDAKLSVCDTAKRMTESAACRIHRSPAPTQRATK